MGTGFCRELCARQEPLERHEVPAARRCITSDLKKVGRSPQVLLFAVSELLMSAEILLFSLPEDGCCFFFPFCRNTPVLPGEPL